MVQDSRIPEVVAAVDWSGAEERERRKTWLAVVRAGRLERLEDGRTRPELVAELLRMAEEEPRLVVGIDFAFAFPDWFSRREGCRTARDLWRRVEEEGERWLSGSPPPFWGRKGTRRPAADPERSLFRKTEGSLPPVRGIGPKSVFQIAGAGSVGTGSVRGMPHLLRLSQAGFRIWPFDPPRMPLALEIYPRYFTGKVVTKNAAARWQFLEVHHAADLDPETRRRAASSEDAFDATVSALAMARHAPSLVRLPAARDARERIEGRIWCPARDSLAVG